MIHFKKLWKVHSWLGLYCGIFIAFLSITGALAVFKNEIDVLFNNELLQVEPQEERLSYDRLYEKLKVIAIQKDSSADIFSVHIPQSAAESFYVSSFKSPPAGAGRLEKAQTYEFRQYFINPYTGAYLGERDYYHSLAFYIRHVHVRFYDSIWGRQAAGIFGIALFVIIVIGFIIYGRFIKEGLVLAIRNKNLRQLYADWHKLIGVLALFFNLVIAVTGAWVGMQTYFMKWFNVQNPGVFKREAIMSEEEDKALALPIESMLEQASQVFPALVPASIRVSNNGSVLAEVYGNVSGTIYEKERHKVVFDKQTGEVLKVYDIRQQAFGDKLYLVQEALHFGDFAGPWLKVFYCLFGLTTGLLSITGFYIYFKRKKAAFPTNSGVRLIVGYSVAIFAVFVVVLISHLVIGVQLTSLTYSVLLYTFLLGIVTRYLYRRFRQLKPKTKAEKTWQKKVKA